MSAPEWTIPVDAEHRYQVLVGTDLMGRVPDILGDQTRRVFLMHAGPLAALAAELADHLRAHHYQVTLFAVPDGEAAKTTAVLARCWAVLGQEAFTRSDVVIGLGGGATTDLAGFVAASWLRGVRVIQIPTTLLAMVDAAVGGKTGINTAEGKNLVGAFHSPSAVLCDLTQLRTLPRPDLVAGLAEVIKCGFIADPAILEVVQQSPHQVLEPHSDELADIIRRAISVKATVVSADLRESHLREILNYGHTLAHAIEQHEDFRWRHGNAVSVGMVFAAELGVRAGSLSEEVLRLHRHILEMVGLPTSYRPGQWTSLLDAMRRDKKSRGNLLRFVVLDDIGVPTRLEGPPDHVLQAAYAAISEH